MDALQDCLLAPRESWLHASQGLSPRKFWSPAPLQRPFGQPEHQLQRNCLHLHPQTLRPWGSSFQVRVKTHQQGCVKEATALIKGILWVSGACQAQQTVTGTSRQRARQAGLDGKILASRGYRCSLARCQQKIPAGWFLPAEGNLGRRKAKPPPFSTLCPIPAPASPTTRSRSAREHPGGGQNSSHKIQLERGHELLNLNTKGKTSLK